MTSPAVKYDRESSARTVPLTVHLGKAYRRGKFVALSVTHRDYLVSFGLTVPFEVRAGHWTFGYPVCPWWRASYVDWLNITGAWGLVSLWSAIGGIEWDAGFTCTICLSFSGIRFALFVGPAVLTHTVRGQRQPAGIFARLASVVGGWLPLMPRRT